MFDVVVLSESNLQEHLLYSDPAYISTSHVHNWCVSHSSYFLLSTVNGEGKGAALCWHVICVTVSYLDSCTFFITLSLFPFRTYLIYGGPIHLHPRFPFLFPPACFWRQPYPCSTPPLHFLSGVWILWLVITMFTAYCLDSCRQPLLH